MEFVTNCWPLGRQSLICYHGERSRRVNSATVATSATLSRPHTFIVSNILCSESISAHDCTIQIINIAFALLQGLKRIFPLK